MRVRLLAMAATFQWGQIAERSVCLILRCTLKTPGGQKLIHYDACHNRTVVLARNATVTIINCFKQPMSEINLFPGKRKKRRLQYFWHAKDFSGLKTLGRLAILPMQLLVCILAIKLEALALSTPNLLNAHLTARFHSHILDSVSPPIKSVHND